MQKGSLKLEELPKREQKLTPEMLQEVFGGCGTIGVSCDGAKDCCLQMLCLGGECVL